MGGWIDAEVGTPAAPARILSFLFVLFRLVSPPPPVVPRGNVHWPQVSAAVDPTWIGVRWGLDPGVSALRGYVGIARGFEWLICASACSRCALLEVEHTTSLLADACLLVRLLTAHSFIHTFIYLLLVILHTINIYIYIYVFDHVFTTQLHVYGAWDVQPPCGV